MQFDMFNVMVLDHLSIAMDIQDNQAVRDGKDKRHEKILDIVMPLHEFYQREWHNFFKNSSGR